MMVMVIALMVAIVIGLILLIISVIAWWQIFTKAGEPGWKAIVPFLSPYTMYKIGWNANIFWIIIALTVVDLFLFYSTSGLLSGLSWAFTIASLAIQIIFDVKLAKAFGKGVGFTLGLIFLYPIFIMMLAFGNAQYIGPSGIPQEPQLGSQDGQMPL